MLPIDAPPLPPPVPVEITLTTERVDVGDGVSMGMVGLNYQRQFTPNLAAGLAVYGATTGDRGGFFAWGANGAYRRAFGPWQAETGLFVGGGGGSPGWVGGGLMLRPHVEISRAVGPLRLGLGVSRVKFPNGQVSSTQPYATLRWSTSTFLGPGGESATLSNGASLLGQTADSEFAGVVGVYKPSKSPRRDASGGTGALQYGGLAFRRSLGGERWLGGKPYATITTLGAIGGGYDGYAELTGGFGLQWRTAAVPQFALRAEAAVGSSGAGSTVDTGGGLIGKVGGALVWQPMPNLSVSALLGRVQSRGRFSANEARLELAWRLWDVVPGGSFDTSASDGAPVPIGLKWSPWGVSTGWVQYPNMLRDDGTTPALGVVALKLERQFGPNWRLVTQAATAATGNAGGYATGHVGVGWMSTPWVGSNWRLGAEATVGAAGGGSVAVNGGLFAQAQLQARYALARDWALQFDVGQLRGARGGLSSPLVGLSLVSSFSRLEGR